METPNKVGSIQISHEDLELIYKGLVLLHLRSECIDAVEVTKLLTKIAMLEEN